MAGEQIHVLIVDDDAGSRLLMRRALERAGFAISEAADGAAAVAAVEAGACNAVLMDVEMPQMNGYEACKAIRALPGGAHLPIMMVTGRDGLPRQAHQLEPVGPSRAVPGARRPAGAGA